MYSINCDLFLFIYYSSSRNVPDIRFRFRLTGYLAIFSNLVPAPVPAKMVAGTGYLSRIVLGPLWQLVHQANSRRSHC